jgi:hypothetical protein
VPCAPCFRSRGCASMACVREVTVDAVLRAVRTQLGAPATRDAAPVAAST